MIEFLWSISRPIDTDGVRIISSTYQHNSISRDDGASRYMSPLHRLGDSVYAEAMKHFIMNPTNIYEIEQLPMVNIIETTGLLQSWAPTTPLWDVSRWLLLIVESFSWRLYLWTCIMACLGSISYNDDYFNRCIPPYCICASGNRYLHVEHWCTLLSLKPCRSRVVIGRISYDYLPSSYHVLNHRGRDVLWGPPFWQCLWRTSRYMRCVHHLGRHKIFRHTHCFKRHIPFLECVFSSLYSNYAWFVR